MKRPLTCFKNSSRVFCLTLSLLLMLQIKRSSCASPCINLDLVVAVDTSSSCTDAEFTKLLSEVKALASEFPIGPAKTRLALISISKTAQVLANFNDVSSHSDFNSAVDRLRLTSERAEISKGMKLARESVLNAARKAPTPKLLVLVKDMQCDRVKGSSDSELALMKSEAEAVRSSGGIVHAVGIGSLWNWDELKALFGENYLLFKSRSKAMESIKSLNYKSCVPANCKNSGRAVKTGTCYGIAQHVLTINIAGALNSAGVGVCRQEIARSFQSCTEKQSCNKIDRSIGSCKSDGSLSIQELWQFYNRKTQLCVTDKEVHKVDCSKATECERQVADVMIVLDRSTSLRLFYDTVVDAAVELVKALQIGKDNVHVGVASFTSVQAAGPTAFYEAIRLENSKKMHKSDILKRVEQMKTDPLQFFATDTGAALRSTKQVFDTRGRRNVSKAVIVITDGASSDPDIVVQSVSDLKNSGVTIYAIGVKPAFGAINKDELKMMTSPESDNNLFILEGFNHLRTWAKKFSTQLCIELKPVNPKLCDADVQLKSISPCVQQKMQTTWVKYLYDSSRKCIKHIKNTMLDECKEVCVDPIDGTDHLEGESWTSTCYAFRCDTGGKIKVPDKTTKCVAADYSCKPIGSAPFQCHNIDGELRDNCQCVDKGGEAVLVVDNPAS